MTFSKLLKAANASDVSRAKALLEGSEGIRVEELDKSLVVAIQHGRLGVVELLLDHGASVDGPLDKGGLRLSGRNLASPLIRAVGCGQVDVIRSLLTRGADANARNARGMSALTYAARNSQKADSATNVAIMKCLIERGADVNAVDTGKCVTALMYAAISADADLVELLVKSGAAVDATHPTGATALTFAAEKGSLPAVKTLVANGADVLSVDLQGGSAVI